jgi:hypothetical protein
MAYRDHQPRLDAVKKAACDLSADDAQFKLAAEAVRIRMAGRFDPMLAAHTSDLEPLPRQIQAGPAGCPPEADTSVGDELHPMLHSIRYSDPDPRGGAIMLTGLRLTNFKSWDDTGPVRLAPLTIFFGVTVPVSPVSSSRCSS